jgi:formylglycine-generating enzyme
VSDRVQHMKGRRGRHLHRIAAILAATLLTACTIESEFVDMIKEKRDSKPGSYRDMVSVPAGTFTQTTYTLSDGWGGFSHTISSFEMGRYEVTYDLWHTVCQWALSNGYTFGNPGCEGKDGAVTPPGGAVPTAAKYEPVTSVNWRDAVVWCNAYSEKSGHVPVYYSDSAMVVPRRVSTDYGAIDTTAGSQDNPYVNWDADGFRLPTQGEWEYAASYRDGTSWTPHDYASGAAGPGVSSGVPFTTVVAWYVGNSASDTHEVGTKAPNQLGIYDMSGNVGEWCWDGHGNGDPCTLPADPQVDYTGPSEVNWRVTKGDSWYVGQCLIGLHGFVASFFNRYDHGFRVARRP